MRRLLLGLVSIAALITVQGCSSDEPKATEKDKANIDRLAKEGIGARPVGGGEQPAKSGSDAEPAPP